MCIHWTCSYCYINPTFVRYWKCDQWRALSPKNQKSKQDSQDGTCFANKKEPAEPGATKHAFLCSECSAEFEKYGQPDGPDGHWTVVVDYGQGPQRFSGIPEPKMSSPKGRKGTLYRPDRSPQMLTAEPQRSYHPVKSCWT